MIESALDTLVSCINEYLKSIPELDVSSEKGIILKHLVNDKGELEQQGKSLLLSLVNIEEERVVKSQSYNVSYNSTSNKQNPEIRLNLFILISANFTDYKTALQYLSGAIKFFQSKNVFTPENTPALDTQVHKLIVELHSLNFEQQNHLWGSLGISYIPSIVYKIRLISIQEGTLLSEQPAIKGIDVSDNKMN